MTEYLLIILVTFVIIYALIKGCAINININVKQEFSQEDRALLEDLYNSKGDLKNSSEDAQSSLDEIVKTVNAIMLGDEEQVNGN